MEIKQNTNGDYLLKDSEGKSHIVRKDLAQQWLDAFGLQSLNQSYKPNLKDDIKCYMQRHRNKHKRFAKTHK